MSAIHILHIQMIVILLYLFITDSSSDLLAIEKIFSKCKKTSPLFDKCIKQALNNLKPYFKQGIPEIGVAPFDPHFAKEIKLTRSTLGLGFTLILRNVYERGWTQSTVTKFKQKVAFDDVELIKKITDGTYLGNRTSSDWANATIVYSQFFPEKYLDGEYEFKMKSFGTESARAGRWSLTLREYAQSTRVARDAGGTGLAVRVEVDRIGDMDLHITNLLKGRNILEDLLDRAINTFWKPGFILVRPLINDLVSTAFTDIWTSSFKDFHVQNFIKD